MSEASDTTIIISFVHEGYVTSLS
uniref:Uncharacterized protein n=1 Tax=Arundo donax TaxID=35708 RepID=A0A0A9AK59_ARUDO